MTHKVDPALRVFVPEVEVLPDLGLDDGGEGGVGEDEAEGDQADREAQGHPAAGLGAATHFRICVLVAFPDSTVRMK